jgi:hypothetical protein
VHHHPQAILAFRLLRHPERDPGRLDPLFGPADALRHRGLRNEEGAGDLPSGQAANRAQGERDL